MSNAVTTIKPHLAAVECPDLLRALPGWLVWRYEHIEGEKKPRKTPYYTTGGKRWGVHGRPEDRQQLTSFDAARAAAARRGFDGVGFCPMPEWGITALDFDGCVTAGGVHPDVERIVAGTYAEFSPSGNGVRAFVRGALVGNRKSNRGQAIGFETFHSNGFVTFTGNVLPITELTDAANTVAEPALELLALCEERFNATEAPDPAAPASPIEPLGLTIDQLRDALDPLPRDFHYDDWLMVGMALHHETRGSEEGFALWDEWSASSGKYSGPDYGRSKWDSFGRGGQRPTTVHRLVRMANEHGAHIEIAQLEADDFDVVAARPPAPAKPLRFQVQQLGDFAAGKPPGWIIKDVLPDAELILLIGESQAGKSFIALDLAGAVARGAEWRGKRVKQGRVVYIVAEGRAGFRSRAKAYGAKYDVDLMQLPFGMIHTVPNMLLKEDAVDVCKAILAAGGADLVIVDTFAQVTPGANENAAEDMGKALSHCRGIHTATGATVLLVHHMGKDSSRGARGWSGLKAAADAELEVLRLPTGRMLRLSKQKDGEDGLAWGFELDQVLVGADEHGEPITSMVVRETEAPAVQQVRDAARGMGKLQRAVMTVINRMAEAQTEGIEVQAVVDEVVKATGREGVRNAKSHVMRALNELCERDDVAYDLRDGVICVV